MKNKSKVIVILTAILALTTAATAQTTRVYVADGGSDAALCTKSAQCKTIAKAMTVVDDGGEIIITESGDYDPFVVTKSATVAAAPGVDAGIVAGNFGAIIISSVLPINKVTVRNLNLINNSANVLTGISNSGGATLFVDHCTFTGFDLGIAQDTKAGKFFVQDSTFKNGSIGIYVNTPAAEGGMIGVVDNCRFEHNEVGIALFAKAFVTIRNSLLSDNASFGVSVISNKAGLTAEAVIDNCELSGNTDGIKIGGTTGSSIVRLSRSTINSNTLYGVVVGQFGTFYSFQNNAINGNATDIKGTLTQLSLR